MEQMDDNNEAVSRPSSRVYSPAEGNAGILADKAGASDARPPTPFLNNNDVSLADLLREAQHWVRVAKRQEETKEEDEAKRRRAVLEAAMRMHSAVMQGFPRTRLYKAVEVSRQEGRFYLHMGALYSDKSPEEIEQLASANQILSLNQVQALSNARRGLEDEESQRLEAFVMEKLPAPEQIRNLVPKLTKGGQRLAEFLKITKEEIQAARARFPEAPGPQVVMLRDKIIVQFSTIPTIHSVISALTQDPDTLIEINNQLKGGFLIDIRRIKSKEEMKCY